MSTTPMRHDDHEHDDHEHDDTIMRRTMTTSVRSRCRPAETPVAAVVEASVAAAAEEPRRAARRSRP